MDETTEEKTKAVPSTANGATKPASIAHAFSAALETAILLGVIIFTVPAIAEIASRQQFQSAVTSKISGKCSEGRNRQIQETFGGWRVK